MSLFCKDGVSYEGKSVKPFIAGLVKDFYQYPAIMFSYTNWCLRNNCLEDVIRFYDAHAEDEKLSEKACYFFAQAILAIKNMAPQDTVIKYLKQSYDYHPSSCSAFYLGSFLLRVDPSLAQEYFQSAIVLTQEHVEHDLFLYLWVSQLLSKNEDEANKTLHKIEKEYSEIPGIHTTLEACFVVQKRGGPYTCDDLLESAGLLEKKSHKDIGDKVVQISLPQEILNWIDSKKIDLGDGYIGIPVHQIRAVGMGNDAKTYYSQELEKKFIRADVLHMPHHRCDNWIGTGGECPRVDIEDYHPDGNASHFQRLRFQQGSRLTFGGLWLPVQPVPGKIILKAYTQWLAQDLAYFVVFNPSCNWNLAEIYTEIFLMDESNRRSPLLPTQDPKKLPKFKKME